MKADEKRGRRRVAIRAFNIGPVRGLVHAQAENLPNVVGIAGPNGSGKSTLLEAIKDQKHTFMEPGSELLYVGPHRSWRSSQLSPINVLGFDHDYGFALQQDTLPGYQYGQPNGLQFISQFPRRAATADDSQALVKTSIVRLHNRRAQVLNEQFVAQGEQIAPGTVPDLLSPLRRLVGTLLPHLHLVRVDDSDSNNIRVVFQRIDAEPPVEFDIDELSSGEKAAISLFLPFVEREAKQLQGVVPTTEGVVPITMLLDEPEIHLHPLLQLNMLDYMRQLAIEGRAQFIFSTQSPALLDAMTDDELFLMSPAGYVGDNQFTRLLSSHERLEIARSITGSTHLLTRAKPIVLVEGDLNRKAAAVTDEQMLRMLVPETAHWAVARSGGRAEVVKAAKALRDASPDLPGQPIFALVDQDTSLTGLPDYAIAWPVTMIENLLLDPEALFELIGPQRIEVGLPTLPQVTSALAACVAEEVENEVRLRLKRAMPAGYIGASPDGDDPLGELDAAYRQLRERVAATDIVGFRTAVLQEVEAHVREGRALDRFHGKNLLRRFYDRHNLSRWWSHAGFQLQLARHCTGRPRVQGLALPAVNRIRYYFPPMVEGQLRALAPQSAERDQLAARAAVLRAEWESGSASLDGREAFRRELATLARTIEDPVARRELFSLANAVGTA